MTRTYSCEQFMVCIVLVSLVLTAPQTVLARNFSKIHLSAFEAGRGPSHIDTLYQLLDGSDTSGQSNAVAFDLAQEGKFNTVTLRFWLRVFAAGGGGAILFLNTANYGRFGPAPFVKNWVEPNLNGTFAVGIDVHNPPDADRFSPLGISQGLAEHEVSLHWDGREIVKRVAPEEFRGDFTECEISVQHVIGGALITVRLAGEAVYDSYFIAGMLPYESRLAIGAGTREGSMPWFDVKNINFIQKTPAQVQRPPKHIDIFNHVLTNTSHKSYRKQVTLPPLDWAYGRLILTLEIHDAGTDWDKWDRNGYLYIIDSEGVKYDIAPFITSFRTPCHWQIDITHFRPLLAGDVIFELATETAPEENFGFMMSASLDFYHGIPELEPYRVIPIWIGAAKYKSAENHFSDFFTPRDISIDSIAKAAKLFITTTGHSKVGEFTPSRRTVIFLPEKGGNPSTEIQFENVLWKDDNYLNPNRPQHGTWQFARAGWAPGDIVRPWWIDLTPYIIPDKVAELRYEPEPYDFSGLLFDQQPAIEQINQAVHVVRSYLILYRTPTELVSAPCLRVLDVLPDSKASRAGIQVNDYLQSYAGKHTCTIDGLRESIRHEEREGHDRVMIEIYRGPNLLKIELAPGQIGVNLLEE